MENLARINRLFMSRFVLTFHDYPNLLRIAAGFSKFWEILKNFPTASVGASKLINVAQHQCNTCIKVFFLNMRCKSPSIRWTLFLFVCPCTLQKNKAIKWAYILYIYSYFIVNRPLLGGQDPRINLIRCIDMTIF